MKRSLIDIYRKQQELLVAYRTARAHRESLCHQHIPYSVRCKAVDDEMKALDVWTMGSWFAKIDIDRLEKHK